MTFYVWHVFAKFNTIQSLSVLTSSPPLVGLHAVGLRTVYAQNKERKNHTSSPQALEHQTTNPDICLCLTNFRWNRSTWQGWEWQKGRSVHGSRKKENEDVFCPSLLWQSPLKLGVVAIVLTCGTLHLHFFFVTSARNSKRPNGYEVGSPHWYCL